MNAAAKDTRVRDLLNLWVSDFLYRYRPDAVEDIHFKQIATELIEVETQEGASTKAWEVYRTEPSPLHKYAEAVANKWGMPITPIGLTMALLGCHSLTHVEMTLAVLQKSYVNQPNKNHDPIDGVFVWEVLQHGTISKEFYEEMWEMQSGLMTGDNKPLLSRITAEDFQ